MVALCALLSGCLFTKPSETEERIFRVMAQLSDFPQGWRRVNSRVENAEGVQKRVWFYAGPPDTEKHAVLVSHHIGVYIDSDAAQNAYPSVVTEEFPTARWTSPARWSYQSPVADQFQIKCMQVQVGGVPTSSCRVIGQYGDMISVLYANVFEDQWFTWEDMERVLKAIDERMAAEIQ